MAATRQQTAIVGLGRWGKNMARELHQQSDLLAFVTTGTSENTEWAKREIPSAQRLTIEQLAERKDIQAVVVATPIGTHADIATSLLRAGKGVLCEKPLAGNSLDASRVLAVARAHSVPIVTGYIFLSHPVYKHLKRLLPASSIRSIRCEWKKYGTFDEPLEQNLLTHHLALAYDLLGIPTDAIVTHREPHVTENDVMSAELRYDAALFTSHIDRTSRERAHTMQIECTDGNAYLWESAVLRKIDGNGTIIFSSEETPLSIEVHEFLQYCAGGPTPICAGSFGEHVLHLHEMLRMSESGRNNGN